MSPVQWVRRPQLRSPQAICAFAGWGDAGDASTGAARYLIAKLEGDAFARLDPDEFYEFQSRRPTVELEDGTRTVHWPANEFHALHHPAGDLVVVLGEEPHVRWRLFTDAIAHCLEDIGVNNVILLGAFLGQVAHTRPVPLAGAAADARILTEHAIDVSGYEGPTGIVGVLTEGLADRGFETMSIWAAVPHYLSNQTFPPAIHALVDKTTEVLHLPMDLDDLVAASTEFRHSVDAVVAENEELRSYIARLETGKPKTGKPKTGKPKTAGAESAERPSHRVEGLVEEIERFLEER